MRAFGAIGPKIPGACLKELVRGLAAAQAVLDAAGVTDVEAARALQDQDFWDISSFKVYREPTPKEIAANAIRDARAAALMACCDGWPKVQTVHEWSPNVISPAT